MLEYGVMRGEISLVRPLCSRAQYERLCLRKTLRHA